MQAVFLSLLISIKLFLDHSQLQRPQKHLEKADPETQISRSWTTSAALRAFSTLRIRPMFEKHARNTRLISATEDSL